MSGFAKKGYGRLSDADLAAYAASAIEELESRAGDSADGGTRRAILAELATAREALERLRTLVVRQPGTP